MSKKVTTREKLLDAVKQAAPQLGEDVVFVAGARKIKNDQMELEFVQSRPLAGRKASLLAMLNEGDARFNTGRITMRVWLMANQIGLANLFAESGINFAEVAETIKGLKDEEVCAILAQVKTINVAGVQQPIKIVCKETVTVDELPKSIRDVINDPDAKQEYKDRYILQNGKDDVIVDAFGNKVYRHFELTYGQAEDVLVADKMLQSEYAKKLAKGTETKSASNVLGSVLAE